MGLIESLEQRTLFSTLPAGFADQTIVSGLWSPTALAVLPDGRWLVTEQSGRVRVVKNDSLLSTPAVTLTVDHEGERGLLGIAVDPHFATNHYFYIYHTVPTAAAPAGTTAAFNRITRYTLSGDKVVAGSAFTVFSLDPLSSATNHNSGALHFGPDGKLYVSVGDNAEPAHAPLLTTTHGKMLRINADGTIPTDNPFYNTATGIYRAIWARGLRNPFTFAFNPVSGRMHINDVGQKTFEEINVGRAGADYGWPGTEGYTSDPTVDGPLYAYGREVGQSITAAAFYSPAAAQFPGSYTNDYFFGDYAAGFIKGLDAATHQPYDFATGVDRPLDLDVEADGSLVYVSYGGTIHRIRYAAQQPATITSEPDDRSAGTGSSVTFEVTAVGGQPLHYQWYRGETPISGATGRTYTLGNIQAGDDNATFWVRVTNSTGSDDSRRATLTVTAPNNAPVPAITAPTFTQFSAGQSISFSGSASDTEDGTLGAAKLSWTIQYITGTVVRPFQTADGVAGGQFTVPTITPYTQPDVKFRIILTATDSAGKSASTSYDLLPRLSNLHLSSSVTGIPILVDGQPQTSPASISSVEGLQRTIEAPSTFTVAGISYTFSKWSDNGPRFRTINTPVNDLNLTATYVRAATGTAQLSGYVVNDKNKDGKWSSGETAIAGRVVYLDANNNAQFDAGEMTQTTASNGKYVFANLPAGAYVLRQVLPANWIATGPASGAFTGTLSSGQARSGLDFGTIPSNTTTPPPTGGTAQLSGYVVNDKNKDGKWSSGEAALGGRTVYLDANNNAQLDAGEVTQITASNGKYVFSNLPAGAYVIRHVLPEGWSSTAPAGGAFAGTLSTGQVRSGLDFGTVASGTTTPPPTGGTAQITGYVVNDKNKDGKWNSGEAGIAGRTVWLDLDNDGVLDTNETRLVTASNGKYIFNGLAAGTYYVREVVPTGWTQTRPTSGGAFKLTLTSGQIRSGNDFTVYL